MDALQHSAHRAQHAVGSQRACSMGGRRRGWRLPTGCKYGLGWMAAFQRRMQRSPWVPWKVRWSESSPQTSPNSSSTQQPWSTPAPHSRFNQHSEAGCPPAAQPMPPTEFNEAGCPKREPNTRTVIAALVILLIPALLRGAGDAPKLLRQLLGQPRSVGRHVGRKPLNHGFQGEGQVLVVNLGAGWTGEKVVGRVDR